MNAMNSGSALLFMKVGVHASETLEKIIVRKSEEIAHLPPVEHDPPVCGRV
jgi:hypothetical protein